MVLLKPPHGKGSSLPGFRAREPCTFDYACVLGAQSSLHAANMTIETLRAANRTSTGEQSERRRCEEEAVAAIRELAEVRTRLESTISELQSKVSEQEESLKARDEKVVTLGEQLAAISAARAAPTRQVVAGDSQEPAGAVKRLELENQILAETISTADRNLHTMLSVEV